MSCHIIDIKDDFMDAEKMVEHHVKYREIHGDDETVWMTDKDHQKLHRRLRKEGKCNVPVDVLRTIALAARERTDKRKKWKKEYIKRYIKANCQAIDFIEHMGQNTQLHEIIRYNYKTGVVSYFSRFRGRHNHKLPVIDI